MEQEEGELKRLREENASLRAILAQQGIEWSGREPDSLEVREDALKVGHELAAFSIQEKIALFRRLFFGRQDVFARRWESSQGKSGYSPVCENEWREGVCEKPRVKCAACSLTDPAIVIAGSVGSWFR